MLRFRKVLFNILLDLSFCLLRDLTRDSRIYKVFQGFFLSLLIDMVSRRLLKESSQGEKSSELIFALILFIYIIGME